MLPFFKQDPTKISLNKREGRRRSYTPSVDQLSVNKKRLETLRVSPLLPLEEELLLLVAEGLLLEILVLELAIDVVAHALALVVSIVVEDYVL
jgi:hypothetical protein